MFLTDFMGRKISTPKDRGASRRRFFAQKALIEKFFPCFQCHYEKHERLECIGRIIPSLHCPVYEILIRYHYGRIPSVSITDPVITPSPRFHMYSDRSLCLYFPDDGRWKISDDVHKKIIPWVAEWLVFYELFLLTGQWLGPEAPHETPAKNPEQVAVDDSVYVAS
jgi:hypothetical protein